MKAKIIELDSGDRLALFTDGEDISDPIKSDEAKKYVEDNNATCYVYSNEVPAAWDSDWQQVTV